MLDTNRRVVDFAVTTADRRRHEPVNVELPFADSLPTPTVAGERYLEFVERAVSLNRDMNQRVADMIKVDNAKAAADEGQRPTAKKSRRQEAAGQEAPGQEGRRQEDDRQEAVAKKAAASK